MAEQKETYETTVRMDPDLAKRLNVISQVLDVSMNQLMVHAIRESVTIYEGDAEYQEKRKVYLKELAGIGG